MTNPFDDDAGTFVVLNNSEGQYSLWPSLIDVPDGWSKRFGPQTRQRCLAYVEQHWLDMRPASLIASEEQRAK